MKRIIFILVVVISFALMGCNVVNRTWTKMSDKYSFENYYVDNGGVLRVNRVLIIPFTNSSDYAAAAKEVMDVFALELNKLNRFEVVNPEENTGAMLPERLAKDGAIEDGDVRSICEAYGTDAVIFGEIKNSCDLYTRERYVTYGGISYEKDTNEDWDVEDDREYRHRKYDIISGVTIKEARSKNDVLSKDYLHEIEAEFNTFKDVTTTQSMLHCWV